MKLIQKPGLIVSVFGILGLILSFAIESFTFLERAIMVIVCCVVIVGGLLAETKYANIFKEGKEESWN